jgi:hypothetical protein
MKLSFWNWNKKTDELTELPMEDMLEAVEQGTWHHDRVVGRDEVNGICVSTVFLGNDVRFGHGEPLLFETMLFKGGGCELIDRYCTPAEARVGHARVRDIVGGMDCEDMSVDVAAKIVNSWLQGKRAERCLHCDEGVDAAICTCTAP